jgi:hypothetical protein
MSQTVIILLVVGVAAVIGVVVLIVRSRPPKEEPVFYFNCPNCRRKLRYRSKQIGRHGACPQCKTTFQFPGVPGKPGTPSRS